VFQVRKKDNGKIYALKVLQKKVCGLSCLHMVSDVRALLQAIIERKELVHTRTEKNVLMRLVHPFLVNMYYYFQTEDRVYDISLLFLSVSCFLSFLFLSS
jgi:serine/threonine protein kinase